MSQSQEKPVPNDEVDLFELLESIWQQKVFILIITTCFSLAGAGYAFLSTPSYESTVYLLPPTEKSIIELRKLSLLKYEARRDNSGNSGNSGNSHQYSSDDVFNKFLVVLQSNAAKQVFFKRELVKTHYTKLTDNDLSAWKIFNKALSIHPSKDRKSSVSVKFQTNNPDLSALWANEYVNLALELTRNQLVTDLQEEIRSRIRQIDLQIENRSTLYTSELATELIKLQEALTIAQALNLNTPIQTNAIINQQQDMMIDEIRKLYRLGAHALKAEITAINKRLENRDFIPGLSALNQQRGLLAGIVVQTTNIIPAQIDLPALADEKAVKPKKALVLLLATVLGIILGLILALIRIAIRNRRLTLLDRTNPNS